MISYLQIEQNFKQLKKKQEKGLNDDKNNYFHVYFNYYTIIHAC